MPPPNVTGALHMGHAMFVTLQVRPQLPLYAAYKPFLRNTTRTS